MSNNCCHHNHQESDCCFCHHEHNDKREKLFIFLSVFLTVFALLLKALEMPMYIYLGFFVVAYLFAASDILVVSFKNIIKGEIFDENFLMSVASIGAFVIGEYFEAVIVMLFYKIGETLQHNMEQRARKSIKDLVEIKPETVNLKTLSGYEVIAPDCAHVGDIIIVKPGEIVPLDGIIIKGEGFIDTSSVTGETKPVKAETGKEILSGSINTNAIIEIKVTKEYKNSLVYKIVEMAEKGAERKAKTESFIRKFSKVYTPVVIGLALIIAFVVPAFLGEYKQWIYKGLVFLVVSCPCALVISVPLSFFGGIGGASGRGILIKGGNCMEDLAKADHIMFDKTGTLTTGCFEILNVYAKEGNNEDLLKLMASVEKFSNHPIAKALSTYAEESEINNDIKEFEEIAGKGISALLNGEKVLLGNQKLLKEEGIIFEENMHEGTIVYVAKAGKYLGYVSFGDRFKYNIKDVFEKLRKLGIKKISVLTGDREKSIEKTIFSLGADELYASLLPQDKVYYIEKAKEKGERVIFVGDGINDAPSIATASVGIAMGGAGRAASTEMADVVLIDDNIEKVAESIKISRKTVMIAKQNIFLSVFVKLFVLILGSLGFANMWTAVFADVGVCIITILNALKLIKNKKSA